MTRRNTFHPDDHAAATACARLLGDCLALEHADLSIPTLAGMLHVSTERLHKWLNPGAVTNNFPLYLLSRWTQVVGPRLLEQVNYAAGYSARRLEMPPGEAQAVRQIATLLEQISTLLSAVAPHLDAHCPHAIQRTAHDAILRAIGTLVHLDHWVMQQDAPLPPQNGRALERRRAA